jgi:hypothetical protein
MNAIEIQLQTRSNISEGSAIPASGERLLFQLRSGGME